MTTTSSQQEPARPGKDCAVIGGKRGIGNDACLGLAGDGPRIAADLSPGHGQGEVK
jgi:NAD(P)-dependent dehydrogenase (short-subunit alcohol dehydrogenase family)